VNIVKQALSVNK